MSRRLWLHGVLAVAVVLLGPHLASPGQWTNWEWLNPTPQGWWLWAAATGNGIDIAVGNNGAILINENRSGWEVVPGTRAASFYDVTWTGELFVAVGEVLAPDFSTSWFAGVVLTSADGRRWNEQARVLSPLNSVHWNGSQVLAVGKSGITATSPSGLIWSEHRLGEPLSQSAMVDVAWNGSSYAAVGRIPGVESMVVFTSPNGVNWTKVQSEIPQGFLFRAIDWGNGHFVAVGGVWPCIPLILTSEDGLSWAEIEVDLPCNLEDIVFGNGQFVGVGPWFSALSDNGEDWTTFDTPLWEWPGDGVDWVGDRYLLTGSHGSIAFSVDGTEWTPVSSRIPGFYSGLTDLEWHDDVVVGIGGGSSVVRSDDDTEWTQAILFSSGTVHAVRWFDGSFWAVGDDGRIASSEDGLQWEFRNDEEEYDVVFFDIASNESVIVAVGWRRVQPTQALVAVSADGDDWQYILPVDNPQSLQAIVWTGDRFVSTGVNGLAATSPDGFVWSDVTFDEITTFRKLAWNGEVLVGGGYRVQQGGVLATSIDGEHWEDQLCPDDLVKDVVWTGNRWVAVGGRQVLTSRDGFAWTQEPTAFGFIADCVEGDDSQIIIGGDGVFIIRADHVSVVPRSGWRRIGHGAQLPVSIELQVDLGGE